MRRIRMEWVDPAFDFNIEITQSDHLKVPAQGELSPVNRKEVWSYAILWNTSKIRMERVSELYGTNKSLVFQWWQRRRAAQRAAEVSLLQIEAAAQRAEDSYSVVPPPPSTDRRPYASSRVSSVSL